MRIKSDNVCGAWSTENLLSCPPHQPVLVGHSALFEHQTIRSKLGCVASCAVLEWDTWRPRETQWVEVSVQWHVPHMHRLWVTLPFSFYWHIGNAKLAI